MTALAPLPFEWTGEFMVPLASFRRRADAQFVIGERYMLTEQNERSMRSHRHFFASVHDGWLNLPEHMTERFPTSEHLRKWCLIKAGFCDTQTHVCSSKAEAVRTAAFIRPMDEFAVITVNEATVTRYTAQSQSTRAMGKERFQESKTAVLEIIAEMVGTTPGEIERNARMVA